jgi:hypothetical protein
LFFFKILQILSPPPGQKIKLSTNFLYSNI